MTISSLQIFQMTRAAGTVLPTGLFEHGATALQPEKRLMLAVLEGAVSDFQKYATAVTGRGRRLFVDAQTWLESTASDRPLDFVNVCQALGLDPSFIRAGLRRWGIARRREANPSGALRQFQFRV